MADIAQAQNLNAIVTDPNGVPVPNVSELPLQDSSDAITANLLTLIEQTPDPRHKFIYQHLVKHLHGFVRETHLSTEEWRTTIQFLTQIGQMCTSLSHEFILLSDVLGVSALVDSLNNPIAGLGATESSLLGPFHTDDAKNIEFGESIASEGKGKYMYVEGRVLRTDGEPIADAVINTWETDDTGHYDTQYADRTHPECRGRLRTREDGSFGFRAIVPMAYPVPDDGPIGDMLRSQGRHNMRPGHLHLTVEAPGYRKLVTAFYIEGSEYLFSDAVLGAKQSLIVKLEHVDNDAEARKRGFPNGGSFKLLKRDIVLLTEEQSRRNRELALSALVGQDGK